MFTDVLTKMKLTPLVQELGFKVILPKFSKRFAQIMYEIAQSNNTATVWIDGDCDCDGYLSARQIQLMLDIIGHTNYFITKHTHKRHIINFTYFKTIISEKSPDYIIILDSSSKDMNIIEYCSDNNINLIIIDHHDSTINRNILPNNILIINPVIDTYESGEISPLYDMSCGAICSLLLEYIFRTVFKDKYYKLNGEHYICGYITLYSDSCPFSLYNVAYAKMVVNCKFPLPPYVECFYTKYSTLAKYFVSWTFVPRINAMIREEQFDMVFDFIFNFNKFIQSNTVEDIKEIHSKSKEFVDDLKEESILKDYKYFKVAHIPDKLKARNYTGLVAQRFVSEYNMPVIGIIEANSVYWGSVRVPYDINLLNTFQSACKAEGHPAAFGIEIPKHEYNNTIYFLQELMTTFRDISSVSKETILLPVDDYAPSDSKLLNDLKLMGVYNEFSGKDIPVAFITLKLTSNCKIYRSEKYTSIKWGPYKIITFSGYPDKGDTLVIRPRYNNSETPDLIVENIILGGNNV